MADDNDTSGLISPCQAGDLKKSQIAMMGGQPCKVMEIRVSKTGKHGHAKCSITGVSVLNGKKFTAVEPSHASMYYANCEKKEFQVIDVNDEGVSCLDESSEQYTIALAGNDEEKKLAEEFAAEGTEFDFFASILIAPEITNGGTGDLVRREVIVGHKKTKANQ